MDYIDRKVLNKASLPMERLPAVWIGRESAIDDLGGCVGGALVAREGYRVEDCA